MNRGYQKYQSRPDSIPLKPIRASGVLLGKVEDTLIGWGMFRFGNQTIQTQGWGATSMNTDWLCPSILADLLKAMSLFITRMASRMIIDLRTLSYLLRMSTGDKLYALTVGRSLQ